MEQTWIQALQETAAAESGPLVAALATVREIPSGAVPEARSVVIRSIGDDGVLMFTSDSRSEKEGQLSDEPRVAVLFWLPKSRSQFRINGSARLAPAGSDERVGAWRNLSDTARAVFMWPAPGRPRAAEDAFAKSVGADVPPPGSFDVWTVVPEAVDTLELRAHPHLRKKWTRTGPLWESVEVNP